MFAFIPWISIVREYERVAVFRLGRLIGYRGPGLVFRWPIAEQFVLVDLRIRAVDVPRQECISKDNVPMSVNAVVYYAVKQPEQAIVIVTDYTKATLEIAMTTLRSVIGASTLDQILADRKQVADELQQVIDTATDEWGVKVSRVEIKDIEIPENLKRVMAKEAEAERLRRAMVIRARGEVAAAKELAQAASILSASPGGMEMRQLQALLDVAEEGNTVVFAPGSTHEGRVEGMLAQAVAKTHTD